MSWASGIDNLNFNYSEHLVKSAWVVILMLSWLQPLQAEVLPRGYQLTQAETVPVIIQLATPGREVKQSPATGQRVGDGEWLNLRDYIAAAQQALIDDMGWQNVSQIVRFQYLPAVAATVTQQELDRLHSSAKVNRVFLNTLRQKKLGSSLQRIGYQQLGSNISGGKGKVVAVIDDGVAAQHPFLQGKVLAEACFSMLVQCAGRLNTEGKGSAKPMDADDSHGTHVAGIVAGRNKQTHGVAKDAGIIAARVTSKAGGRTGMFDSDILAALEWVLAQRAQFDIVAVNLSLGGDQEMIGHCDDLTPYTDIFKLLRANNIIPVTAAGNEFHTRGLIVPACVSYGVSVGALTPANQVADYSNTAPELKIMAPGSAIVSSVLPADYAAFDGTSMAAPHVAGAIAVLAAEYPEANAEQLIAALGSSSQNTLDPRTGRRVPALHLPSSLNYLQALFTPVPLQPQPSTGNPVPAEPTKPTPAAPAPTPVETAKPAPVKPTPAKPTPAKPAPEKCQERVGGILVEKAGKDCKPKEKIDW